MQKEACKRQAQRRKRSRKRQNDDVADDDDDNADDNIVSWIDFYWLHKQRVLGFFVLPQAWSKLMQPFDF